MEKLTEKEAIEILKKHAPNEKSFEIVLKHAEAVKSAAIEIAQNVSGIDMDFIKSASILHDIGRFKHPPGKDTIKHGIAGAQILRSHGLEKHARVAERHLGTGITIEDIKNQNLKLPPGNYTPQSKEEKIITFADNLIFGSRKGTLEEVKERFRKEIGEFMVDRLDSLAKEIESWKAK